MMPKQVTISLVLIGSSLVAKPMQERLEKDIAESDLLLVERCVQEVTQERRKEDHALLDRVIQLADEVYALRKSQKSLYNDTQDSAYVLIGLLTAAYTGNTLMLLTYYGLRGELVPADSFERVFWNRVVPVCGTLIGGLLAYKGFLCESQTKRIEQARQIKKLLKERPFEN